MTRHYSLEPWHHGDEFKPGKVGALQDVISVFVSGRVIAHVNCGFGDGAENARLIAAAPQLLAALEAAEGYLANHADRGDEAAKGLHAAARAAIAKAGQS